MDLAKFAMLAAKKGGTPEVVPLIPIHLTQTTTVGTIYGSDWSSSGGDPKHCVDQNASTSWYSTIDPNYVRYVFKNDAQTIVKSFTMHNSYNSDCYLFGSHSIDDIEWEQLGYTYVGSNQTVTIEIPDNNTAYVSYKFHANCRDSSTNPASKTFQLYGYFI